MSKSFLDAEGLPGGSTRNPPIHCRAAGEKARAVYSGGGHVWPTGRDRRQRRGGRRVSPLVAFRDI